MRFSWLPWRWLVSRIARANGFIDPIALMSFLEKFSQPSEVQHPKELLRAGALFHARGLMNTRVIQQNLDWVWPYWVSRQFDPGDVSFIPRAFSITHVNLTHRNWTAVGIPGCGAYPIIDPAGLTTPLFDGWSIDAWVIPGSGADLIPPHEKEAAQRMIADGERMAVETIHHKQSTRLNRTVWVEPSSDSAACRIRIGARSDHGGWLAVALRPYNPEGVSFIHDAAPLDDGRGWTVNQTQRVELSHTPHRVAASNYENGDVYHHLFDEHQPKETHCRVGLATAAALYALNKDEDVQIDATIDLNQQADRAPIFPANGLRENWREAAENAARLKCPDEWMQTLYRNALHSLILHAPEDVFPGPYTYRRFWFRDAAYIINALLGAGLVNRAERALERFPARQTLQGYFSSQEGEWDSNGEALWIMNRFCEVTGAQPNPAWIRAIRKGASWIAHKRTSPRSLERHAGLLPAGFSAEHLGNNDFYYWDDFWSVAGLRGASAMMRQVMDTGAARRFEREAESLMESIEYSLKSAANWKNRPALPASPYRRMDSGAVGSICAAYPLDVLPADDSRLANTLDFLLEHCFVRGGFFQDMIHSGINAYLTLQIAQILLASGDERYAELIDGIAKLASPTGQWPEAIHPRTGGGCMGDGHHVWAAAEWVMMMRNLFVRESGDGLILASGILPSWREQDGVMRFGPTPTPYGRIEVTVEIEGGAVRVFWRAEWRNQAPRIEVRFPGCEPVTVEHPGCNSVELSRREEAVLHE
ncbi:MAG: hypothetical protein GC154_12775 [bacterium]|nr:hypothetical protein [bacterium]